MTAATVPGPVVDRAPVPGPTLGSVLRSEWIKFAGLRSSWATVALGVLLSTGLGALVAHGRGSAYAGLDPADRATFDPTALTLTSCTVLAQLVLGALGILVVTAEYATGTIRPTVTAVPRRCLVPAAKTLLVAVAATVVGELASFGAYLVGQPILAAHDAPHTDLADPGVLRAVVGCGVLLGVESVLGLALGMLLRTTAGALTVLTTCTLIVPLLASLLPSWLARWWPPTAGSQIITVIRPEDAAPLRLGAADLLGAVALVLAAAFVTVRRRDV